MENNLSFQIFSISNECSQQKQLGIMGLIKKRCEYKIFLNKLINIIMNDRGNQKKLVQAFKTFFDKSISPYVFSNDSVMNEWKYFSRLISTEPIDYSQIQFYLLLANKSQHAPQSTPTDYRNTSYGETFKYNSLPGQTPNNKGLSGDSDKKSSNSKTISSPKKKNLVACLQSFQTLLLKNQQKLESFTRKEAPNSAISVNNSKRYY